MKSTMHVFLYHMSLEKANCGKSFSSEYIRASVASGVKELIHQGLISDTLAQKMLALSSTDLEKHNLVSFSTLVPHFILLGTHGLLLHTRNSSEPICIKGFGSGMSANAIGVGQLRIAPSRSSMRRSLTVE